MASSSPPGPPPRKCSGLSSNGAQRASARSLGSTLAVPLSPLSYTRAPLAQAGAAMCAPLCKHGAQGQRPTTPKSLCASRRPRRLLLQRRQPPSIKPHHRGTPPQPTRPANPHHDRRSTPKKPKFWMTAPHSTTMSSGRSSCLVCATQPPWAAASTATSMQAAPQGADGASRRGHELHVRFASTLPNPTPRVADGPLLEALSCLRRI